jgi:hypothetical protein
MLRAMSRTLALSAIGKRVGPETGPWCDEFAGEPLMPSNWAQRVFGHLPA